MKFKTQFDPKYKGKEGLKLTGESQTIPDQTMTLRQLVINNTNNIGSNLKHYEGYHTEEQVAPNYTETIDRIEDKRDLNKKATQVDQQVKDEIHEKQKAKEAKKTTRTTPDDPKKEKGTNPSTDERSGKQGQATEPNGQS